MFSGLEGMGGKERDIFWLLLLPQLLECREDYFIASGRQVMGYGRVFLLLLLLKPSQGLWRLLLPPAQFAVERGESLTCSEVKCSRILLHFW